MIDDHHVGPEHALFMHPNLLRLLGVLAQSAVCATHFLPEVALQETLQFQQLAEHAFYLGSCIVHTAILLHLLFLDLLALKARVEDQVMAESQDLLLASHHALERFRRCCFFRHQTIHRHLAERL
jgi:hypothetical protein